MATAHVPATETAYPINHAKVTMSNLKAPAIAPAETKAFYEESIVPYFLAWKNKDVDAGLAYFIEESRFDDYRKTPPTTVRKANLIQDLIQTLVSRPRTRRVYASGWSSHFLS